MIQPAAGPRYQTLDHWRGFAALWVVIFHGQRGKPELAPSWVGEFVSSGWLGVFVFFVISGYCIAERTAREYRQGGSAGRFLIDRLLRIYPPYWIALLATLLLNVAGALVKGIPIADPAVLPQSFAAWFASLIVMEPWLARPGYVLVAWTLTYEIGFYLLAAAGLYLVQRTRRPSAGFAWCAGLCAVGLIPPLAAWLPLLILWPHFALGILVWLICQHRASVPRQLLVGTGSIGAVCLCSWAQPAEGAYSLRFACGFAWLLLALRSWDGRLAGFGGLRWLGGIGVFSYSLYLMHAPIVGKAAHVLESWPPMRDHPILELLFSSLCTLPCAWIFYQLIERRTESYRRASIRRMATL